MKKVDSKDIDGMEKVRKFARLLKSSLPKDSALNNIEVDEELNCVIIKINDEKLLQEIVEFNRKKKSIN